MAFFFDLLTLQRYLANKFPFYKPQTLLLPLLLTANLYFYMSFGLSAGDVK
jgi:hypothetical protein